jgi:hypothetical protein
MRIAATVCLAAMLTAPAAAEMRPIYVTTAPDNDTSPEPPSHVSRAELYALLLLDRELRERAADPRTAREKCIDEELARLREYPSRLAMRAIDLKCSGR